MMVDDHFSNFSSFRVNVGTSPDTSSHTLFLLWLMVPQEEDPPGTSTVTITENLPYSVSSGMAVLFLVVDSSIKSFF